MIDSRCLKGPKASTLSGSVVVKIGNLLSAAAQAETPKMMNHITAFELPCAGQADSPLFDLPGEIRDKIFTFTLNCYDNPAKLWDKDTSYVRPDYSAPPVADTALLRTCQRAYTEGWFRPWISAVHTFYLAWAGRRPSDEQVVTLQKLQPTLDKLYASHGQVEISHIRVFAQLFSLEPGREIGPILDMSNFFPRKMTITIRHHDWWYWESDSRLHIRAQWVNVCRFPDSLREICMELESLQRKKAQINSIADDMVKHWHFQKKDGTIMSAKAEDCTVYSWNGSSTWEGRRWVRDETKPGTIEYYVKTVVWRPNREKTERPLAKDLVVSNKFRVMIHGRSSIPVQGSNLFVNGPNVPVQPGD